MTDADSDAEDDDPFTRFRPIEATLTSNAADGATVDLNGTQVFFKQNRHIPVLVEIYIGDEEHPIGAINIARGETVTLGGVQEGLSDDLENMHEALTDWQATVESLMYRTNPPKTRGRAPDSDSG